MVFVPESRPCRDDPISGMISPIMGALSENLSSTLFGKIRSSVLALLFCRSDESFYFREIVRYLGKGRGAVQRELENLVNAGLVVRRKQGNQVYYQANPKSAIFSELKSLMIKTGGVAGVLRESLTPLEQRIRLAFIFGSFAKGKETANSDVDVLIIGDVKFSEVVDSLGTVEESITREVNPNVYPEDEFIAKVSEGHHFVTSLIEEPKIFLIGDEDVFAGLVEKRLAG
jgi:predicted nucleotidyltransferase